MTKKLRIKKYKKFENIDIHFSPGINAISGTNGTCKTTLLHMVSNSFQAPDSKQAGLHDPSVLRLVNGLNAQVNTKIEKLAKGDREYNDPAPGYSGGNLFEVEYNDGTKLAFRKHNSRKADRYAIKPYYKRGSGEKLPSLPVVYLSLSRLLPWGEYQDDASVKKAPVRIPDGFYDELSVLYFQITDMTAQDFSTQKISDVKKRQEFKTENEGIDSNTVSSGEDNVLAILIGLLSLKYYYEALDENAKNDEVCSILLIDEFDATLHPSFQYELLNLMKVFSDKYHIQIIFTTHSITLLDYMFTEKLDVIYLMDQKNIVTLLESPDPLKIEMFLKEKTKADVLSEKIIPIFTEDREARLFLQLILEELGIHAAGFREIERNIHMIDANFGSEQLTSLFRDIKLRQSSMSSICILDGDHQSNISNNIVALPGKKAPEWVAFSYACELAKDGRNSFWSDQAVLNEGFTIKMFDHSIRPLIKQYEKSPSSERENVKKLFNENINFFILIYKAWLKSKSSKKAIRTFAGDLEKLYRKTANYHGIYIPKEMVFECPN